jgi:hypothetical protein
MEVLCGVRPRGGALTLRVARAGLFLALTLAAAEAIAPAPSAGQQPSPAAASDARWPVKSREHVDLWLHGFAMISDDSSPVPFFRRGYREAFTVEKNGARILTDLDANRDALAGRLQANPALVNAQFLPLYFESWAELEGSLELFLKADGSPRAARNEQEAGLIAFLAAAFPGREDRDFARRMLNSLRSEREHFYHAWWLAETRRRDASLETVDTLWRRTWRPKLQTFLDHTQQGNGEVVLTLALEGEGRTVTGGKQRNTIAVGFPDSAARSLDAIFALAHEMVGPLTGAAVADNTTPAEKRSGAAERLSSLALVRGGALLLAHVSKEAADGYARFYLRAAGLQYSGDAGAALAKAFPVPQGILDSIARQIEIAFGGI